jgi:hypothetical protein
MKNFIKIAQVMILVILWGGAQAQSADVDLSGVATAATTFTPTGSDVPMTSLFDNGPIFNSTGTGSGGANESIYYQGGLGTFGSGCQYVANIFVADDFIVPSGVTWAVTSIDFFSYQTNSPLTPTFTGIYVRIWNGKPGVIGSAVVWGDMTTNRLGAASFSNVYRTVAVNGGTARPIMKVVANTPALSLATGTYWVEWACTGTLGSGPWAPPVVTGSNVTGNAIQTTDGGVSYLDVAYNTYAQGFPFVVNGTSTVVAIPALSTWGLILLGIFILGTGVYFGFSRMS